MRQISQETASKLAKLGFLLLIGKAIVKKCRQLSFEKIFCIFGPFGNSLTTTSFRVFSFLKKKIKIWNSHTSVNFEVTGFTGVSNDSKFHVDFKNCIKKRKIVSRSKDIDIWIGCGLSGTPVSPGSQRVNKWYKVRRKLHENRLN